MIMAENICKGLIAAYPEHTDAFLANLDILTAQLDALRTYGQKALSTLSCRDMITFHDGFQYFAAALDLPQLRSVEEEAGSEASAKEIVAISQLVKDLNIPVIFTEVNGSDATAKAIARETRCSLAQLSMIMDGRQPTAEDATPIAPYTEQFLNNVYTLINGFAGREVLDLP